MATSRMWSPKSPRINLFLIFTSKRREAEASGHEKLFIVRRQADGWGPVLPLRYTDDDANGGSEDDDARLGLDQKTLYFSSDRSVPIKFPRSRSQAERDFIRMQTWDNGNLNIWSFSLPK